MDSLLAAVTSRIGDFQSVVVKGSRFMKMERVVEALLLHGEKQQTTPIDMKGQAHVA
jgi:UDP-N-acetylmuramoyl-tripeptide--D-alanyl-D-alanine ligase